MSLMYHTDPVVFNTRSCGTCYEVRCRDAVIHDGYG